MALTGNEIINVQGVDALGRPAATTEQTTTGQIAALANGDVGSDINTNITTVGNGTLTAAGLAGGVITRSGSVAAFTDTTATGAQIYTVVGSAGVSFYSTIKNTTAFMQTIAAGSNITLPASVIIPPNSAGTYLVTIDSATAATFVHVQTVPLTTNALEHITALSTVGAGTVTGAGIAGAITTRSGSQSGSPFTDTTDTAANIIVAQPNAHIGASWEYKYVNHTNAVATITGGSGVTVSAVTIIPANSWVNYLVTYTAANTVTMVGVGQGFFPAKGTFTADETTPVTVSDAAVTVDSIITPTLKTIGGTVGALPAIKTITPGTGFTIAATALDTSIYNYEIRG